MVSRRRTWWRRAVVALALLCWTWAAASCAGVVAMGAAHGRAGEWPVGATVALVAVAAAWVGGPAWVWRRRV